MTQKVFRLRPSGKDYIWGGESLKTVFEKNIPLSPLAETWECSIHPDGPSYIVGGEYDGKTFAELLSIHPEFLGTTPKAGFPVLVKFIDAEKDLSVQVHPDDEYALKYENGSLGKTEMWYVVDAKPGARLVYGLKEDCDAQTLRQSILDNTIMDRLNSVSVNKGDVFFIQAGTIHAIGAGALIAEIQQNSNLTYRLYDYARRDKNGNLRELHIDKSVAVSNTHKAGNHKLPRPMQVIEGATIEQLCSCKYFSVDKVSLDGDYSLRIDADSFRVYLCIEGDGTIDNTPFKAGECFFVPADSGEIRLQGKAVLLDIKGA